MKYAPDASAGRVVGVATFIAAYCAALNGGAAVPRPMATLPDTTAEQYTPFVVVSIIGFTEFVWPAADETISYMSSFDVVCAAELAVIVYEGLTGGPAGPITLPTFVKGKVPEYVHKSPFESTYESPSAGFGACKAVGGPTVVIDPLMVTPDPGSPLNPMGPVAPVGPVGPVVPVVPDTPVTPVLPVLPVGPVRPVGPVAPVAPV